MYLGFDVGTQGIRAILTSLDEGKIVASESVSFGRDFALYMSPGGFLPNKNVLIRHADPLMWLDGLDLVLKRLASSGADMASVRSISGSAQQHGTVYLNESFGKALAELNRDKRLSENISCSLSRSTSPIWMDHSTSDECAMLLAEFGSEVRTRTGSAPTERFAGPQIMKFARTEAAKYEETAHVHLVSSFLCSVLSGANAPVDFGDGAGMNLLNLETLQWDTDIVEFTAKNLTGKLPEAVPGSTIAGRLSPYFTKYGLKADLPVIVWTGDNPSSLIGCGAFNPGSCIISLGTSDVVSAAMTEYAPPLDSGGNVFGNPAGGYMGISCFTNGSSARNKAFEELEVGFDFADNEACLTTVPGNNGKLMLPYYFAESTPPVDKPGVVRNYDPTSATRAENVRALFESQAVTMRLHSKWLSEGFESLRVTGGASRSAGFRQIIANVFQAHVLISENPDTAALGAALRACEGAGDADFSELTEVFCKPDCTVEPDRATAPVYDAMLEKYEVFEKSGN